MSSPDEFSRPAAVAAEFGTPDGQWFFKKRVLLCGEAAVLATANGYEAFRAAYLLLIRICENVWLQIPEGCTELRADIATLGERFTPDRVPCHVPSDADLTGYDSILCVGVGGRRGLPWTVINSDGWLARVSSQGMDLPFFGLHTNAIGAMGAACLGVAETFKRLIDLRPERGALLDATTFSFWSYLADPHGDVGPTIAPLSIDILLVGCGAIGSGVAYLLSRLPLSGRVFALDRQAYKAENFGTSINTAPGDYGKPKACVTADLLKPRFDAESLPISIGEFGSLYDQTFPDVVVSALDDVEPRHELQRLWPGLIIDGAVGGEFTCQVSCHPWQQDVACLLCLFQQTPRITAAELTTRATGLPSAIANDPTALVTEEIIAQADEDRRSWLRQRLGKPICSIVAEAVLQFLGRAIHPPGFAPAVPFVSCFSAAMMVTELIRYTTTGVVRPAPRYQMNLLWGPSRGLQYEHGRNTDCFCVERKANIGKLRAARGR